MRKLHYRGDSERNQRNSSIATMQEENYHTEWQQDKNIVILGFIRFDKHSITFLSWMGIFVLCLGNQKKVRTKRDVDISGTN